MRFTIRDLFWLVLAVALIAGWWGDHSTLSGQLTATQGHVDTLKVQVQELHNDLRFVVEGFRQQSPPVKSTNLAAPQ
jgi:hypothetical protein